MGSQTAALKFSGVRMLSVLGWRISIKSLAGLGVTAWIILVLTVLACSLFALRLIRDGLAVEPAGSNDGTTDSLVVILALTTCLYFGLGAWTREAFSSRRFAVRFSPNRGLYRAVDVGMDHVFLAEALPRAALLFGPSAAICTAALLVTSENGNSTPSWYGILWVAPFLVTGSWLALSARLAAVDPQRATLRRKLVLTGFACLAAGIPGFALGRFLTDLLESETLPVWDMPAGFNIKMWVVPAALTALALCIGGGIKSLSTIKKNPFPVTAAVPTIGTTVSTRRSSALWLYGRFLALNVVKDKSFTVFSGIAICLLLLSSLVLGLRLGGIGPSYVTGVPAIPAVAGLVVFMVSLIGSELISKANNPAGLLPRLRYAWESGVHAGSLAWAVIITQSLPLALLAAPTFGMIVWVLTGTVPIALLSIPWTIAVAGIIGNTLSRIRATQADGSMETSLAAAFIGVVLAVPAFALCLQGGLYPSLAAVIYAALLTGGAHQCMKRRILSRP